MFLKPLQYFNQLNEDYLKLHRTKEDLFWTTYMGTSQDHDGFAKAESEFSAFISNSSRISELRHQIKDLEQDKTADSALIQGLSGWLAFFEANAIETKECQQMMSDLIHSESVLFKKRQDIQNVF